MLGHADSVFSERVTNFPTKPQPHEEFLLDELRQYRDWQWIIRYYDVIHDFSHQHLASRYMPNLPSLNIFWHAPALAKYPKSPYNIIGLSKWACREFRKVYHQEAKYQYSVCIDTDLYKPLPDAKRNDRFLSVGRMGAEKGNLNSAMLCKELGVPLDIVTARGTELNNAPLTDYEKQVMALADGEKIKIWWEKDYTEESKIKMMQTCKALIYVTDHPEVTNHKVNEAMLCGAPIIAPKIGALPEIVTDGVDGILCSSEQEFIDAVKGIEKLPPLPNPELAERFGVKKVVGDYLSIYEQVAGGLRWR
uniref:Putative glycosyltransferase n=1 Tax=viral metagenome TaxID=1070528 RepID=A0A6M3JUG4_9ZZZZ